MNPQVTIVIAARNNSEFLCECIGSALTQSVPCDVVYSDDCSTDDSLKIAYQFSDRISVLQSATHQGVCAARNRGASFARSRYLVFLDGDDRLPQNFAEEHLAAVDPFGSTPFAYGPARIFGQHQMNDHVYHVPEWETHDVWWRNTVNTSALYSRWAFEAVHGWRDLAGTMWDWDLALRVGRLGIPRPSRATLDYRFHGASWSDLNNERDEARSIQVREKIRRQNVRLTIGCIYSGRLPGLFPKWISDIARSITFANLIEPAEIVIVDNSPDGGSFSFLSDQIGIYQNVFRNYQIVPWPTKLHWSSETERRKSVSSFMADASNVILERSRGDILWLCEDDVLVPSLACDQLLSVLVSGDVPPHAISGVYRNRHRPDDLVFGNVHDDGLVHEYKMWQYEKDLIPIQVDVSGTGCLMFWKNRPQIPKKFFWNFGETAAHDWRWCMDLRKLRGSLQIHCGVRCGHALTETEILEI